MLGVGDDAAVITLASNHQLLVSTDTMISGVHFFEDMSPFDIAYRATIASLSDIVAMGGTPKWVTLSLTLPVLNEAWLASFSKGLKTVLDKYRVILVGGDTTKGALSVQLTAMGDIPKNQSVTRQGACVTDRIFINQPLGLPYLFVEKYPTIRDINDMPKIIYNSFCRPTLYSNWAPILRQFASAAIDISDGLQQDLGHILQKSQKGAILYEKHIPIHPLLHTEKPFDALDIGLSSGDEYALCFTIPECQYLSFKSVLKENKCRVYEIGEIVEGSEIYIQNEKNELRLSECKGYQHF
jgi:thiamine-monophosphate kinase